MRTEVSVHGPFSEVLDTLEYRAGARERNELVVRWIEPPDDVIDTAEDQRVELLDPAGISPGKRCFRPLRHDRGQVICLLRAGRGAEPELSIRLGDRADLALVESWPFAGPRLSGGRGADRLRTSSENGASFSGGRGNDVLVGGPGDDLFDEGRRRNGSDTIRGGERAEEGGEEDLVFYGDRRRPVHADLDGHRDDGERGERDRIGADVEALTGGTARDRLTGNGVPNVLVGGRGSDLLRGGGGADTLSAGNADTAASRFATRDSLFGGPGRDILNGTRGSNLLVGGAGADYVDAGRGNDRVDVRDGSPDAVRCGAGSDHARLDMNDFFSNRGTRCERVRRRGEAAAVPLVAFQNELLPPGFGTGVMSLDVGCPSDAGRRCTGEARIIWGDRVLLSSPFALRRGRQLTTVLRAHPGSLEAVEAVGGAVRAMAVVSTRDRRGAPRETSVPILITTDEDDEGTAPP